MCDQIFIGKGFVRTYCMSCGRVLLHGKVKSFRLVVITAEHLCLYHQKDRVDSATW